MTTRRQFLLLPLGPALTRGEATTRLVFGGDVMLSRYVARLAKQKLDPAWPFREIAPFLAEADIAFINLESPFTDRRTIAEGGMIFGASPEMVDGLRLAGIDVVSTANNHARDCGAYGLEYTIEWLERNGIAAVGTGRSEAETRRGAVLARNGIRFGFLGYTYDQSNGNHTAPDPRIAMLDVARMREDVSGLRNRCDAVIVSMHAGAEYKPRQIEQQEQFARGAIDAGAQVVVGHHPHVVQPVERYKGGVIFYSLGNLVFDQFQRRETQEGLLAEVRFRGNEMEGFSLREVLILRTVPRLKVPAGG